MANSSARHPSNHELELYLLDRLKPYDAQRIEEHYLSCKGCVGRISAAADFLDIHNVTPGSTRALVTRRHAPHSIRPARPIPWGNLAASVLIVAAAANIYQRDATPGSKPPALPPVVARVSSPILAPAPDSVAIQPTGAMIRPASRKSHRVRWATAVHARRIRRAVPPRPEKTFEPPQPSRVFLEARAPGLEMPSLEIKPSVRTAEFHPPSPAAPEFRPKRNRFIRVLAAIGRHLKPKSA